MEVLPIQAQYLINGLKHCQFSSELIMPFSEKLKVSPILIAEQLANLVEQLPKVIDPKESLEYLNKALLHCEKITNGLKERLALKIAVSVSEIHQ